MSSTDQLIEIFGIEQYRPPFSYTLEERVGTGALCRGVFKGTAQGIDMDEFAVKCIKVPNADYARRELNVGRKFREFRSIIQLNQNPHKNVLMYYYLDLITYDGEPEIRFLMEYCPGETLETRNLRLESRNQRYTQAAIIEDFAGILNGLGYLHDNNIVHRDLRGQNILFTASGTPKIADFGLAIQLMASKTGTNEVAGGAGTANYRAPETFHDRFGEIGRASDVWSAGCVLLEMLLGHPPRYYSRRGGTKEPLRSEMDISRELFSEQRPHYDKTFNRKQCGDGKGFHYAAAEFLDHCFAFKAANRETVQMLLEQPLIKSNWKIPGTLRSMERAFDVGIQRINRQFFDAVQDDPVSVVALGALFVIVVLEASHLLIS
ncbi:probable serine/threonine-protein kinase DDB_G0284251 [Paramacrobiotus metropolitanus]|uniref:probable serine/threonine-protein kinase DDB_G0284251 n=1 Tax=Paramacrobiotus metropolitanus TaxID=2943436 RepID=UPI0024458851|nr:probable serine/threonine-protein kinase DDB_G0284251 [Paramacrobiotus metropolitanus]